MEIVENIQPKRYTVVKNRIATFQFIKPKIVKTIKLNKPTNSTIGTPNSKNFLYG